MATKKNSAAAGLAPVPTSVAGGKREKKIPLEKLRRSCVNLFGITPSTFDGATHGLTGKYSVEEMQAIIKAWLKKEVK